MSSDKGNRKKGFAGLDSMVSDVDTMPLSAQPKATSTTLPEREPEPERRSVPQPTPYPSTPQYSVNPTQPYSGWTGPWIIGVGVIVVLLIVVVSLGGRNDGAQSRTEYKTPSTTAPSVFTPAPSVYAVGIPDISSEQERLLNALLQVGQSGNATAIGNAASAIQAFSSKPTIDKAAYKDSREKNKAGLQRHKEGRDDLAAGELFAAYKLNPYDPEIADNLGYVLYYAGDYLAAKKAYLAALISNPRRASAWLGLAKVFAANNSPDKAGNAFALAFQFSKAPKTLRRTLLTSYREEKIPTVRGAIGAALAASYSAAVANFLKPAMGNLANVEIPVFLPTKFAPLDFEGKPLAAFVLNNKMFGIEATSNSYRIPFGSEADCEAMACGIGVISASKAQLTDSDEGESVDLEGGIKGIIVKGSYRQTDHLVFRIGDVRYVFSLGSSPVANVEAANTALKLGAIPNEILSILPKMAFASSPPPEPVAQYPVMPPPAQAPPPSLDPKILRPPSSPYCTTTYDISLETFGEGVSVELRRGSPGNSTMVDTAQSSGGIVRFSGICAGPYFLAIGNSDSVSVTPVRDFENNMEYRSSIRMQRGLGNVSTKRRNEL